MSRKYIRQQIFQDFVYPNNEVSQYDVDDIVHDLNENSVSGVINSFSASGITSSQFTLNWNLTWDLNGAEPFIRNSNVLAISSIHCLAPGQNYYKPWRTIVSSATSSITSTTFNAFGSFNVTAAQLGLPYLTSGVYYFEIRFIGHRSVYPIITTLSLVVPTPTPTPTMTLTPTVTPTATPGPTPTPTPTPGGVSLQIYARDVATVREFLTMFYSVNGGGNINVPGATATRLPLSCGYIYTITGLSTGDLVTFGTDGYYAMDGNSGTSCPASTGYYGDYSIYMAPGPVNSCAITVNSEIIA